MFNYISETNCKDNKSKLDYILKKKNIKYVFNNESLNIILKKDIQEFSIYYTDNYVPLYIMSNLENDSKTITKIYEDINNNIDEYDSFECIVLDIVHKTSKCEKTTVNIIKPKDIKKDLTEFEKELDIEKEKFLKLLESNQKLNSNTKLFSPRSNIEMLGDQILKLHKELKFNVLIEKFPIIKILVSDFTFVGSNGLVLTIIMDMNCLNLVSEPPKITLTSNKILKDNILKVISELKPFSDVKSWSIKYSISESVQNIFNMINTFGEIEQSFSSEFDQLINDLEYLVSIKNQNISETKLLELFDKELLNNNKKTENSTSTSTSSTYWKKGTGYGNDKTKKWDIDQYIKNVNEKKNKISIYYNKFIESLCLLYSGEKTFESVPIDSLNRIINLLVNYFQNEEITKTNCLLIFKLINNNFKIINPNEITKFVTLIKLIQTYLEDNDIPDKFEYLKNEGVNKIIEKISSNPNGELKKDIFIETFESESFKMYQNEFKNFYYKDQTNIDSDKLMRLKKEFNIIKKSIFVNSEASMFFWIDKNKLDKMRFIITGPADTPYEQGLYIFDMTINKEFPTKPPLVHFSNNGGVRFNPNLYNCGKVCLSLLGTWSGDKGESWNSATSTFFQVLVSIQSQILIEEPFFNEPGYERQIGKESGKKNSKEYNENIRQYNLDYAINGLIDGILSSKSSYPEFEYIIKNYFKYKKDRILKTLSQWEQEFTDINKKNKFINSKNKFIELSSKL